MEQHEFNGFHIGTARLGCKKQQVRSVGHAVPHRAKMEWVFNNLWRILMYRPRLSFHWTLTVILFFLVDGSILSANATSLDGVPWQPTYAKAMALAEQQQKMLFVFFYDSDDDRLAQYFEWNVLDYEPVLEKLKDCVCVKVRLDEQIRVNGKETKIIDHAAFAGLNGRSGLAILDFAHKNNVYYGCVVNTFPFSEGRCYSTKQMGIILDLPAGRPEQRRAAYLLRTRIIPGRNSSSIAAKPNLCPDLDAVIVPEVAWITDYAKATAAAEAQNQMLFVYFCDCGSQGPCERFKMETLDHPQVRKFLQNFVCVQLPLDAKIVCDGKDVKLLEHEGFHEMLGKPGIAIVDYAHDDSSLRGMVVSTFPITEKLWYTPKQMAVILTLPPGTLTQRTLIYAVKTHPETPASADSQLDNQLIHEAQMHAQYQADIRLQGHHHWDSRFQRILTELPSGLTPKEVCAESWPGENLVEAAIECVRCWRLSDGHWNAVRSPNQCFGYDMKRGGNGIWYATGIFGSHY
jgi:hypothetical protein